jgi:hypothetical protein
MNARKTNKILVSIGLVIVILLVGLKYATKDEVIELPSLEKDMTACEILDSTENGYENDKLVNECLDSISK